jgi:hypothetical protein
VQHATAGAYRRRYTVAPHSHVRLADCGHTAEVRRADDREADAGCPLIGEPVIHPPQWPGSGQTGRPRAAMLLCDGKTGHQHTERGSQMTTTLRTSVRRMAEWLRAGQPPATSHIALVALAGTRYSVRQGA